jgi:hypothetical protein
MTDIILFKFFSILSSASPFRDPLPMLDHFQCFHKESINENDLGTKFDKVTVVQVIEFYIVLIKP